MTSTSALEMASLTVEGAPSTRSLASFRPSPVISRITLMTVTFLSAGYSLSVTVNSVCSSTGAAAAPRRRRTRRHGHRGGRGDAELLLHVGDQLDHLDDAHLGDRVEDFIFRNSHCHLLKYVDWKPDQAGRGLLLIAHRGQRAHQFGRRRRERRRPASGSAPSSRPSASPAPARASADSPPGPGPCAVSSCPPSDTAVVTSLSLSFAKALTTRAAAPGSSFEKASTSGPLSTGPMHSNDVPATALRASEFLTTRTYTPGRTRLGAQLGHLRHGQAAVLGRDHGQCLRRHRADLGHQRLLVFQVKSHSNLLALKITLKHDPKAGAPTRGDALRRRSTLDGDPHQA